MSVLGIILVVLLGLYVVMTAVDRFWYQKKLMVRNLPDINAKLADLEKRVDQLEK